MFGPLILLMVGLAAAKRILFASPLTGYEYSVARELGYETVLTSLASWLTLPAPYLSSFDAIVLPSLQDHSGSIYFALFGSSRSTWSSAIDGNIMILGFEPASFTNYQGAVDLVIQGLRYVVDGPGTGLYFVVPNAGYQTPTVVDALSGFGVFSTLSVVGCHESVQILSSPASLSLTAAELIGWGCIGNTAQFFKDFPSSFSVFAVDNIRVSSPTSIKLRSRILQPLGYVVMPYILIRDSVSNSSQANTSTSTSTTSSTIPSSSLNLTTTTPSSFSSSTTATWIWTSSSSSTPTTTATAPNGTATTLASGDVLISTTTALTDPTFSNPTSTSTTSEQAPQTTAVDPITSVTLSQSISVSVTISPDESIRSTITTSPSPSSSYLAPLHQMYISSTITEAYSIPTQNVPTSIKTSKSAPTTNAGNPFPEPVAVFSFLSCAGSNDGYPTFTLALSSQWMDLEMCATACENYTYAGVYNNDCYCAVSNPNMVMMQSIHCNMPCPGNVNEHCGGNHASSRYIRRQTGMSNVLLTVYINLNNPAAAQPVVSSIGVDSPALKDVVTSTSSFVNNPEITDGASVSLSQVTTSIAIESAPTVPSDNLQAPEAIIGSVTAGSSAQSPVPQTASSTGAQSPSITTTPCIGNYCSDGYVFVAYDDPPSPGDVCFTLEACDCVGGSGYFPNVYSQFLPGTTVYEPLPCSGDVTTGDTLYHPQACDECLGGVMFLPKENSTPSQEVSIMTSSTTLSNAPPQSTTKSAMPTANVVISISIRLDIPITLGLLVSSVLLLVT